MSAEDFFAQSYAEARAAFLADAEALGLQVQSHPHPMRGRDGEALAMDVLRDGPADAASLLMISSACHGLEGFCGSGVQRALLADETFRAQAREAGVAVLYIHGVNPWGFSWLRRTTHENVDLNRNFHDFGAPLPANPGYDELADALVPAQWPAPEADARLTAYIAEHGLGAFQTAITIGQHKHPDGLFYSGRAPTWSQQTLRRVLHDHGQQCRRLGWIDVHTGLGPNGHGERIFACRDDAAALARARAWWGPAVTSIYDGSSGAAELKGVIWAAAYEECPQAEYTGIVLEYGTIPGLDLIDAMRAEQWLENHPEAPEEVRAPIKRRIRDAFYIDTASWKQQIIDQAQEAARQAVVGLGP